MPWLPIVKKYNWLSPVFHFLTSGFVGMLSYFVAQFLGIFSNYFTLYSLAIFTGMATHVLIDFNGWF